jgi:3-hydroxybutyrate dehydrogenase
MANRICTILITGAGSGLGRGLSLHFAGAGHRIIAADLKIETAKETISLMGAAAKASRAHELDVASESSRQAFFQAIADVPVDVLINNAGLQHVARLEEFPQAKWEQLVDVMLNGPAAVTRAVLPGMRKNGYGRIVNIGSIHSLVASPFKSAYNAAKHGLLGLSKTIALETADVDITINTLCPSYIRTPLVDAQIANQAKLHKMSEEEVIQKIMLEPMPKKAFITIEEIAGAIEFLMSPAARNITGTTISIDGGWTAR